MKKSLISFFLLYVLFSSYLSKKLPILAEDDEICVTSFEDGDFSMFTRRGETEVLEIKKGDGKTGSNCLAITNRTESWNGAQFALDEVLTPGFLGLPSSKMASLTTSHA